MCSQLQPLAEEQLKIPPRAACFCFHSRHMIEENSPITLGSSDARQRAPKPCLLANLKRLHHRYLVGEQPGLMNRTGQRLEQAGPTEQSGHSSPSTMHAPISLVSLHNPALTGDQECQLSTEKTKVVASTPCGGLGKALLHKNRSDTAPIPLTNVNIPRF